MPSDGEVHVLPVQGNVYMLVGAGGNVAVQIGDEGVLVVDTGTAQMSDKVLAAIKKLSPKTDPLHHQHAPPSGSHRRQRSHRQGRQHDAQAVRRR